MTNDELNRAVAELRGWTPCGCERGCPFWHDPNGELHLDVPDEVTRIGREACLAYVESQEKTSQ